MDNDKLEKQLKQKMNTIMVGSLAIIEDELEELLRDNPELYGRIRKRIFDNGNNQINAAVVLLNTYTVKSNRHYLKLPIKPRGK